MLVPFVIVAVIAAGLLVLLMMAQQRTSQLTAERDQATDQVTATAAELATANGQLEQARARVDELDGRRQELVGQVDQLTGRADQLSGQVDELTGQLDESASMLRKRTELADAQAMQIDTLSAERDDLQQQLNSAEERIVTLAARPGVVVGDTTTDDAASEMLWDLEVARSERAWRNSVAINPVDDPSPFERADDPLRTVVEIEAWALREDVGALIEIEWKADPIPSAARRLLVARVAQEMLALAARAPGAARLVVTQDGGPGGSLTLEFESADDASQVVNLIPPPQIAGDLIDISDDAGLSVTVKAE